MKYIKNKITVIITLFMMVVLGLIILLFTSKKPLERLGYNTSEIAYIESLDPVYKEIILKYPFQKNLVSLLKDYPVKSQDFEVFYQNVILNPKRVKEIYKAYKLNIDWTDYVKYPFYQDKFYINKHRTRYLKMWHKLKDEVFKNESEKARRCVELVNAYADYPFYSKAIKADLSKNNLVLVNKFYYLEDDYVPSDLVNFLPHQGNGALRKEAYDAFVQLQKDAKKDGYEIFVQSPFRTYGLQVSLYNRYSLSDGKRVADTYSARPGYSEHQTGLVVDVIEPGSYMEIFHKNKAFEWMSKNHYKYGFILRYNHDKEPVTGYIYESWHYRYVGKDVAKYIYDNNITLDEYYEYFVVNNLKPETD